jgi:hypothetical protein
MTKYRKKPVVIEAIRWDGENMDEIKEFTPSDVWFDGAGGCYVVTLEGTMQASIGDYIIRGVHDEFYPCKPDIFEKTYEKVIKK